MEAIKPILYYSIFNYPLNEDEIFRFSKTTNKTETLNELNTLVAQNVIEKHHGFYVYNNDLNCVKKRLIGNENTKKVMPKALKRAQFISKFPYIESVNISGSLSKGYYDNDGDIDFFLITKPNRLWIARTLLIAYKKIVLQNSKKYFCVNYFISSNQLEILEKNLFTATELTTLIPVTGKDVFIKFKKANQWANNYFPNNKNTPNPTLFTTKPFKISKLIEFIMNTKLGNITDDIFRQLTLKRWTAKFSSLEKKQFEIALKSTKSVSKHHPQNFQKKVLDAYNTKVKDFEKKYHIKIN